MKIWECSAEFNGRMTLKIQSYSASLNGFKFNPNTDYFFLGKFVVIVESMRYKFTSFISVFLPIPSLLEYN